MKKTNKKSSRFFNRKRIAIMGIGIAAVIAVTCVLVMSSSANDIEVDIIDEQAGEYILTNVPTNYSFEIEPNKSNKETKANEFKVLDIYGEEIRISANKSNGLITIKAPDNGYEQGGVYTIDLDGKAGFKDERYRNAKKLLFVVKKKNTAVIKYQKGVKEPKEDTVKLKDNTMTLEGKYSEGDIVVIDTNNDAIDEIYKLQDTSVRNGKTIAAVTEATEKEIYKYVDVFYYDSIDFAEAEIDEDAFAGLINQTGIWEAFVEDAYAATKNDIEITSKKSVKDGYEITVTIHDPRDRTRTLEISFGIKDKILYQKHGETVMLQNKLSLIGQLEFTINGENEESTEKKIKQAIKNYQSLTDEESSPGSYDVPLVPIKIPIIGPIFATIDMGLTSEIIFSAELNSSVDTQTNFIQGVIYNKKKHEVAKKYAEIIGSFDAHLIVKGKLYAFAGAYIDVGVEIPYMVYAGINAKGGPYIDASGCFYIKGIPDDIKTDGYYKSELGLLHDVDAVIDVALFKPLKLDIAGDRKPLFKFSNYLDLNSTNLDDTYYKRDEGLWMGDLEASYHNVISGRDEAAAIKEYKLYVDGEEVEVTEKYAVGDFAIGKHSMKLTWEHEGKTYADKKDIEVVELDPWGYYLNNRAVGRSALRVDEVYGPLEFQMSEDEAYMMWEGFTIMTNNNMFPNGFTKAKSGRSFIFVPTEMEASECLSESGTVSQLFGMSSDLTIKSLEQSMGLSENNGFSLQWTTDILYNAWVADVDIEGKEYSVALYPDVIDDKTFDIFAKGYDQLSIPRVTPDDFHKYFKGYKGDPKKISPSTRVVISNQTFGD